MCLVSNTLNKQIAKQDYTVYKLVKFDTFDTCRSLVFDYVYTFEKLYELEQPLSYENYNGIYTINKGFHSYANPNAIYCIENLKEGLLAECTIPKGTLYHINKYDEIVSNQIIVHAPAVLSDIKQFIKNVNYGIETQL